MYGKLAYMYGKIGCFEYLHGLRKQNLSLDVWKLGFLAAECTCFNPGISVREAQVQQATCRVDESFSYDLKTVSRQHLWNVTTACPGEYIF